MPKMKLPVNAIQVDASVLPRIRDDDPVVGEYAEILRLDAKAMPPPVVFFDDKQNWLADGVKRLAAYKRIGVGEPICDVRKGSRSDAIFYAAGANREHGVRLTSQETRRAVENLLKDAECGTNSDGVLADQCGVSTSMVQKRRAAIAKETGTKPSQKRKTRAGKTVTQAPSGKGGRKKKKGPKPKKPPSAGEPVFDALEDEVPDWCRQVFVDRVEITNYWNGLAADVIEPAERLAKLPSGAGKGIEPKAIAGWVNEIRKHVRDVMPHAVCPECREAGKPRKSCDRCGGDGWLTKPSYEGKYLA